MGPWAYCSGSRELYAIPHAEIEIPPQFPCGNAAFMHYITDQFNIPAFAVKARADVMLILRFVVDIDGGIKDIQPLREIGFGTTEQAIRVLSGSPRWQPGRNNGAPVRTVYTLPLRLQY